MSNSYLQFSFGFNVSAQEKKWLEEAVGAMKQYSKCIPEACEHNEDIDREMTELEARYPWLGDCLDKDNPTPNFGMSFDPLPNENGSRWAFSAHFDSGGEDGNAFQVAVLLRSFLRANQDIKHLGFEWAFTCSKLREGEWGGGAFFITAEGVQQLDTGSWLAKRRADFDRSLARKRARKTPRSR